MTTMTARAFNQDLAAAKRAARSEPVVVTDRGEPAYVLLNIDDYRRLTEAPSTSLVEALRMEDDDEIEFLPMTFEAKVPDL